MIFSLLTIPAYIWLLLSALFFAAGEFLSKKFALEPSPIMVFYIVCVYALGTLAWLPAIFKTNQLAITGTLWSVLSLGTTIVIGVFLFGEKLSLMGFMGISFAILAIVFLSLA